jgi:hypothetical protein
MTRTDNQTITSLGLTAADLCHWAVFSVLARRTAYTVAVRARSRAEGCTEIPCDFVRSEINKSNGFCDLISCPSSPSQCVA